MMCFINLQQRDVNEIGLLGLFLSPFNVNLVSHMRCSNGEIYVKFINKENFYTSGNKPVIYTVFNYEGDSYVTNLENNR